jgi:NAD+ kinase
LSIGGDGTFLDTALLVKDLNIPILGINTGRLGFLSNTPTSEITSALNDLLNGNYSTEERSMLCLESDKNHFGEDNFALNEISILKSDSSSMITIHTELNGTHLNSYWTDGLIISTATGSTAYSLSCGGPIMMPGSGNFVITPIAPHNLNVRPIVIDDGAILKVRVESRSEKNLVAMDSRSEDLLNGEVLTIQKAEFKIAIVQLKNQSFVNSLRNKLNWGLDQRNG